MEAVMQGLTAIAPFDCTHDERSLRSKWEKWKRSLEIFFDAASIQDANKKRALLLHSGGSDLQEIFFNLPGASIDTSLAENRDVDVYKHAIEQLDKHFAPKQSRIYERHLFRLISQATDEKFDSFLIKLRRQAAKCQFSNVDENIIDQIVEKCNSEKLRRKILEMDDAKTLNDIISVATSLETVQSQMDKFTPRTGNDHQSEINKIQSSTTPRKTNKPEFSKSNNVECFRCGLRGHVAKDSTCPARNKKCLGCGKMGHFKVRCRTRSATWYRDSTQPNKKGRREEDTHHVEERDAGEGEEYIFHMDEEDGIKCVVGGIEITMVIDSGSKSNIISETTWKNMKNNGVKVVKQMKGSDKTFKSYANSNPLVVLGSFESKIEIPSKSLQEKFYVVKNGRTNLLGKETAIKLGVLKLGLDVQSIDQQTSKPFPKIKGVSINIPINAEVNPVIQPLRRIPIPLEEKVNTELDKLIQSDIIEPVNGHSEWVSPMVPVLKSNGEVRLCIDMRRANLAIRRENHPLPTMDAFLPKLRKARLFSKLDVKQAFHQIEISKNTRYITTFITHKGLFRYKRLLFGITCAPEIFQKIMEGILSKCEGCFNFIDDIIIHGQTEEEHENRLFKVRKTLDEYNVLLNLDKCIFKVEEVEFLAHILTKDGVRPAPSKIEAIKKFRKPQNPAELSSFLGLITYVGKFIPNLATTAEPLRSALKETDRKTTVTWDRDREEAFEKLKRELSSETCLGYYCPHARTQLIADASPVGLGAVLIQFNTSNEPRIIAFGNKTLSVTERKFCQTEKEALALVWAVEHFYIYLFGKEFELVTDHKPLQYIFTPTSKPCARVERWVLRLQCYQYKVIYKPGKSNIADPLSRLCVNSDSKMFEDDEHIRQIVQHSLPVAIGLAEIRQESENDMEIQKVREGLNEGIWDNAVSTYRIFENELCFYGEILLRGTRIVIPHKLRQRTLQLAHTGHPGIMSIKKRLRTKVWWPRMDVEATEIVKRCKGCTLVSAPDPPEPLRRRELPSHPWVDVAIDYLGPLPSGECILVIIDYFSRFMEVGITKVTTADITIKILRQVFTRLGYPYTITADNGPQFGKSKEFQNFCKLNNIKLFSTIPYWPQQNGEVERQNRSLLKRLKISKATGSDWKADLQDYLLMYHNTPHSTTGKTPAELMFGRLLKDALPMINNYDMEEETRDRDKTVKHKGKEYADRRRHAKESELAKGDTVIVKRLRKETKLDTTFQDTPHTVLAKEGSDLVVQNNATGEKIRRNVLHLKKVGEDWTILKE